MKQNITKELTVTAKRTIHRLGLCLTAALLTLACKPASAWDDRQRADDYRQVNLVSDLPGVALLQDANLVNAWGISFSPTSPFWVSDNGTGLSTLYVVTYDANGAITLSKRPLEVAIPGEGTPTGQVFNSFNGAGAFNGDLFIFASEDGVISGWRNALGTTAEILASRTGAVYKGITLTTRNGQPVLLAANFAEGTLDAYESGAAVPTQFKDTTAPAEYAPFNVQALNGMVFVTFAKRDPATLDDVPGRGHGLIDVFAPETGTFHRFATGSDAGGRLRELNSPWGLAVSPTDFGAHADQLLVGNFGSGTIMSFEANGKFKGLLEGRHERPIVIDGLWGLAFGNGGSGGRTNTLYFTAGPAEESHGLFGSLDLVPEQKPGHDHDHDRGHDHDRSHNHDWDSEARH